MNAKYKRLGKKKCSLLLAKIDESIQWKILNVNLWGPKSIANVNGMICKFRVITMVNPITGWCEQQKLFTYTTTYRCQEVLDMVWLSCYPRKTKIGVDNGF